MREINRLNEEIARWAFEVIFKKNTSWKIAFTNPTAGPWKTIKAYSEDYEIKGKIIKGELGEVYRFALQENRPDIIMYNDELKIVIIFEAKDSLEKLMDRGQPRKSASVVAKLAKILKGKTDNIFWKSRTDYNVVLGLLWGSISPTTQLEKDALYDCYYNIIKTEPLIFYKIIIGVETIYLNGSINCMPSYKIYDKDYSKKFSDLGNAITKSLNI